MRLTAPEEKILARTMHGIFASSPFPQTLKKPCNKRIEVYYLIKRNTYSLGNIDHSGLRISRGLACILGHEGPKLVKVHRWEVELVFLIVEMSLSLLSVVAWMTVYHKNILVSFCGKHAVLRQACP